MPTYGNPLYANGVPTYSNEVGALGDVFKAMAPNPLRDLQIQGYASNARLAKLRGDVIQNQQDGLGAIASAFENKNYQGVIPAAIRGNQLKNLDALGKAVPMQYSFQALEPGAVFSPEQDSALATVVGGTGGNVANTAFGFKANQDRQTAEANMKNDTTMRGQNIRSADARYGTDVGAASSRYATDTGSGNSTYSANLQFLKPSARSGGLGAGGTNSTSGGSAASELNPKGVTELDSALANVLTGRAVPDADRADLAARTQAHYLAQPKGGRNFQLAANQAVEELQAGADLPSSTKSTYWGMGKDQLVTKAPDKRAPLPQPWQPPPKVSAAAGGGGMSALQQAVLQGNPNLRQPLSAAQINVAPAPVAAPAAAPNPLLSEAASAIASGAPRDAVIQRLRGMGVSDADLQGL